MEKEEREKKVFLIHLLKEKKNYNKYLFVNNYVPAIMIRKGFDYVDSYLTAPASDNFFLFDEQAVNYKKDWVSSKNKETLLRPLYINNKGQIAEVIKRKMRVSSIDPDSLQINKDDIPEGVSRIYRDQTLTDTREFMSNIISINEFEYFYVEKSQNKINVYKIKIINNYSVEAVISNVSDCKGRAFMKAELIYNGKGEFVDVKVTDDMEKPIHKNIGYYPR